MSRHFEEYKEMLKQNAEHGDTFKDACKRASEDLIWNYFSRVKLSSNEGKCNLCDKVIKQNPGSVGNLRSHIHCKHPDHYKMMTEIRRKSANEHFGQKLNQMDMYEPSLPSNANGTSESNGISGISDLFTNSEITETDGLLLFIYL